MTNFAGNKDETLVLCYGNKYPKNIAISYNLHVEYENNYLGWLAHLTTLFLYMERYISIILSWRMQY